MEYLSKEEIDRAKGCIANIQDKLYAVVTEIQCTNPYKSYLKEKLESIKWDTDCLLSMCNKEE